MATVICESAATTQVSWVYTTESKTKFDFVVIMRLNSIPASIGSYICTHIYHTTLNPNRIPHKQYFPQNYQNLSFSSMYSFTFLSLAISAHEYTSGFYSIAEQYCIKTFSYFRPSSDPRIHQSNNTNHDAHTKLTGKWIKIVCLNYFDIKK